MSEEDVADLGIAFAVPPAHAGLRLDVALSLSVPALSRTYAARLLKLGTFLVDGKPAKASHTVKGGEQVRGELPEPEVIEARPENIPLDILFEDRDIIVVNKAPGMVSHPSTGHNSGSLVNALLFHCTDLSTINGMLRPGIVHRLDKDTSGAIVAAKNDAAHRALAEQFASRTIKKEYVALCHGSPLKNQFQCDGRIGRHPVRRTEMTVVREDKDGREAHTDFEVLERLNAAMFFVRAMPRTGRTHQIRVHLAKSGFPILADALYGREAALPEYGLLRHALHAQRITFNHPASGETLALEAPLARDIQQALDALRA